MKFTDGQVEQIKASLEQDWEKHRRDIRQSLAGGIPWRRVEDELPPENQQVVLTWRKDGGATIWHWNPALAEDALRLLSYWAPLNAPEDSHAEGEASG